MLCTKGAICKHCARQLYYPILELGRLRLIEAMELIQGRTAIVRQMRPRMKDLVTGGKNVSSLYSPRHSSLKLPGRLLALSQSELSSPLSKHSPRKERVVWHSNKCRNLGPGVGGQGISDY